MQLVEARTLSSSIGKTLCDTPQVPDSDPRGVIVDMYCR